MPLSRFAFIVKAPGYNPLHHQAILESPRFITRVIGVSRFEEAAAAADEIVAAGTQLIELCGGFSPEEADMLRRRLGPAVAVGIVRYSDAEAEEQVKLFHP